MTRLKRETDLLYGLNAGGEALYSLASTSILFFFFFFGGNVAERSRRYSELGEFSSPK